MAGEVACLSKTMNDFNLYGGDESKEELYVLKCLL